MILETLLFPAIFLFGSVIHAAISKALMTLNKIDLKEEFGKKPGIYFFYFLAKKVFPDEGWKALYYLNGATKQINRILYATTFCLYLFSHPFSAKIFQPSHPLELVNAPFFILSIVIVIVIGLFFDFIGIYFASHYPEKALRVTFAIGNFFYMLYSPITLPLLKIQKVITGKRKKQNPLPAGGIKDKIFELVSETEVGQTLEAMDKKLLISVANFRDRIAREVMVPRINVTLIEKNETVEKAMELFIEEGYSRIPVYEENIDHVIGVLLYKDLISFYTRNEKSPAETKVSEFIKPIVYTPETKKIAQLLQEFRNKQSHLAIVVDEYGGTEGIVTIEDILEEIVGEIADEFDDADEELLFSPLPDGGYIVDAQMNIIDIEKELKITIPLSPEYDTIGGYIYHHARSIPPKGWRIHHDNFDLEVLSSSDRSIEKIKIQINK